MFLKVHVTIGLTIELLGNGLKSNLYGWFRKRKWVYDYVENVMNIAQEILGINLIMLKDSL